MLTMAPGPAEATAGADACTHRLPLYTWYTGALLDRLRVTPDDCDLPGDSLRARVVLVVHHLCPVLAAVETGALAQDAGESKASA